MSSMKNDILSYLTNGHFHCEGVNIIGYGKMTLNTSAEMTRRLRSDSISMNFANTTPYNLPSVVQSRMTMHDEDDGRYHPMVTLTSRVMEVVGEDKRVSRGSDSEQQSRTEVTR